MKLSITDEVEIAEFEKLGGGVNLCYEVGGGEAHSYWIAYMGRVNCTGDTDIEAVRAVKDKLRELQLELQAKILQEIE